MRSAMPDKLIRPRGAPHWLRCQIGQSIEELKSGPMRSSGFLWESGGGLDKLYGMEELLPPQTQHGAGFELTRVRQFTVFLENRVGRLQMLMRALEEGNRVCAISIEESADAALVR